MAQDSIAASRGFDVATVLSTSVAVLRRNLATFLVIAVLIGIPYIVIIALSLLGMPGDGAGVSAGVGAMMMVGGLVALLTYVVAQAAINYGAFQDLRGRKAEVGECLRQGFAALPRVIGVGLVAILVVAALMGAAMFLAVIPIVGLIITLAGSVVTVVLLVNWWVVIPATVVEKTGVIESFNRSRALTAGNRWRIFALLLVVGIAQIAINFVVQMLGHLGGVVVALVLTVALTLFFIGFNAVMTAVGYYHLRAAKEGIVLDDIVRVFD